MTANYLYILLFINKADELRSLNAIVNKPKLYLFAICILSRRASYLLLMGHVYSLPQASVISRQI